jgi:putative ABC transport system substrate-binding protein
MWYQTVGCLVTLILSLLVTSIAAEAQQTARVWRIGFLSIVSEPTSPYRAAFLQGLRELGYVEGQSIAVDFRLAGGKTELLPGLAADLVRSKVDVIFAASTQEARAAKEATDTIPIVVGVTGDAVGTGLVASLAQPDGNVTGLTRVAPELSGKQLELLKEALPRLTRVGVLWNPVNLPTRLEWRETQSAAERLGITVVSAEVSGVADVQSAILAMAQERVDALIVFVDPITVSQRTVIADLATSARLPMIVGEREFTVAGGLMSYGVSIADLFRRAASYVDKILKGAKPADLPVEQPMKFELVINLKTATALGLTMPPMLLFRADEVIR